MKALMDEKKEKGIVDGKEGIRMRVDIARQAHKKG